MTAVLTLPNGDGYPGVLRFSERPDIAIRLAPRHVNTLKVLLAQWQADAGRPDGSWMTYARIAEGFRGTLDLARVSRSAAQHYVAQILKEISDAFHGDHARPELIEKGGRMGVRLTRRLIIDDRTLQSGQGDE